MAARMRQLTRPSSWDASTTPKSLLSVQRPFSGGNGLASSSSNHDDERESVGRQSIPSQFRKVYRLIGHTTTNNPSGVSVLSTTAPSPSFGSMPLVANLPLPPPPHNQQQQTAPRHSFLLHTDLPLRMGGQNSAPQPLELLLAALIGCTQATAAYVARQMNHHPTTTDSSSSNHSSAHLPNDSRGRTSNKNNRWKLDRLEFNLTAVRDERGALHLSVPSSSLDDDSRCLRIPSRLQRIEGTVSVFATTTTTTKQKTTEQKNVCIMNSDTLRILQEETELRCPVANMMVASGCEMNVVWVDGNTVTTSKSSCTLSSSSIVHSSRTDKQ